MDEQAYKDRFLHDFSAGFGLIRGGKDGKDDYIPADYAQACIDAFKEGQKESTVLSGNGFNIQYDSTSNAVVIQAGGRQHIELSGAQWPEFVQLVLSVRLGESSPVPTAGYGGQSSSQQQYTLKEDRPVVLERMRQNDARMEYAFKQMKKLADKAAR